MVFSLRNIMGKLPNDGKVCHAFRQFNMAPKARNAPQSVKELAQTLGFDVDRELMPRGVRGRLEEDAFSENGYRIIVNKADNVRTQRWTVLHEIGHFFLHAHQRDWLADPMYRANRYKENADHFYLSSDEDEEREANRFVEDLVFGDGALAAAISLYGEDILRLSKHFGFSEKAIEIALQKYKRAG